MKFAVVFDSNRSNEISALVAHHNTVYSSSVAIHDAIQYSYKPGLHAIVAQQDMYNPDTYDFFDNHGCRVHIEPTRYFRSLLDRTTSQRVCS